MAIDRPLLSPQASGTGIRILSRSAVPFRDRRDAGRRLAHALEGERFHTAVVLGIPRGGVVVAAELAIAFGAELDVVLVRKVGAPGNPELAIGAISENGQLFLDEALTERLRVPSAYITDQRRQQLGEIARRVSLYRAIRSKIPLAGRVVILSDDGLATGATMQAALWAVRRERPARLVVAVPVAAPDVVERLAPHANEIICLQAPEDFVAVGRFYQDFEQVSDDQVLTILTSVGLRGRA